MLDDLELSLMAFPQTWTAATHTLAVNLLVLPVGDPTGAVGSVPAVRRHDAEVARATSSPARRCRSTAATPALERAVLPPRRRLAR